MGKTKIAVIDQLPSELQTTPREQDINIVPSLIARINHLENTNHALVNAVEAAGVATMCWSVMYTATVMGQNQGAQYNPANYRELHRQLVDYWSRFFHLTENQLDFREFIVTHQGYGEQISKTRTALLEAEKGNMFLLRALVPPETIIEFERYIMNSKEKAPGRPLGQVDNLTLYLGKILIEGQKRGEKYRETYYKEKAYIASISVLDRTPTQDEIFNMGEGKSLDGRLRKMASDYKNHLKRGALQE